MRVLPVERRCPTCGSGDLLERLRWSPFEAFDLSVPGDGGGDEPGHLCVACESEFLLESELVR